PFLFPDDYVILASLSGHPTSDAHALNLWRFSTGDPKDTLHRIYEGTQDWFLPLTGKAHFLRVLASPTLVLDYALFGRRAWGFHLTNILWYFAVIAVVRRLYVNLLPGGAAAIATWLF